MPISYLEEYLTLASQMNFSAAARRLNLTQSALSKHIAALEAEFDAVLIDRSSSQIELTHQGRIFCEEASKMLEGYRSAQRRVAEAKDEIRLAGSLNDSAIRYLIGAMLARLRESDADLLPSPLDYPAQQLPNLLAQGKVDAYIDIMLDDEEIPDGFESRFLASVPLVAVMNRTHPLAGRPSLFLADIAPETIMHPTGSLQSQRGAAAVEAVFQRHGIKMNKYVFFAQSSADFPSAELGSNIFVMPRSLFSRQMFAYVIDSYVSVPLSDEDARFPYRIVWRAEEPRASVLAFVKALLETAKSLDTK